MSTCNPPCRWWSRNVCIGSRIDLVNMLRPSNDHFTSSLQIISSLSKMTFNLKLKSLDLSHHSLQLVVGRQVNCRVTSRKWVNACWSRMDTGAPTRTLISGMRQFITMYQQYDNESIIACTLFHLGIVHTTAMSKASPLPLVAWGGRGQSVLKGKVFYVGSFHEIWRPVIDIPYLKIPEIWCPVMISMEPAPPGSEVKLKCFVPLETSQDCSRCAGGFSGKKRGVVKRVHCKFWKSIRLIKMLKKKKPHVVVLCGDLCLFVSWREMTDKKLSYSLEV